MLDIDDKYFECPYCGFLLTFHYDKNKGVYTSYCPFCKNRLEMSKEEYEKDDIEIYFKHDFL